MCRGSKMKASKKTGLTAEDVLRKQEGLHHKISALLEFSASDDVTRFKDAVEREGHDVGEAGFWYGMRVGSKEVGFEERTPLMIASMFGSKGVLSYILGTGRVNVNQACGSDGATALHCAAAGGSADSPEVIKILLDASADVNAVDAAGNRSCDLIPSVSNSVFNSRKKMLQAILEGASCNVGVPCNVSEEAASPSEWRVSKERAEKKDFRVDPSLPDIKNGIYGTDEFRMYTFKVKPCSRAYSHDWTECPFVHPGENARRRDLRKYNYSCVPCPEFRKGSCSKGDTCEYAHGIFECWLHPAQYRTRLCKDETACSRRVCFFAHKPEELRPLYASTGSAMPSPTSYAPGAAPLEIGSISPFSLGSPSAFMSSGSTPPLTPSNGSSPTGGTVWPAQSHVPVPTLQLPKTRFKTSQKAKGIALDIELLGLENRRIMQQLMIDEMSGLSSASKWSRSMPNSPSFTVSFGDHAAESNMGSAVSNTSLEDIYRSRAQSPTRMQVHQNVNQQMWGYSSCVSTSNVIGSPPYRVDPIGPPSAANSRSAAFPKRSMSFTERDAMTCDSGLPSPATSIELEPYIFSGWSSPDGKLDWSVRGDELNKMRRSSSFEFRNGTSPISVSANATVTDIDEPAWLEQLCMDQEQIVT